MPAHGRLDGLMQLYQCRSTQGSTRRRQTGGLMSRSVTFRTMTILPTLRSAAILAMALVSGVAGVDGDVPPPVVCDALVRGERLWADWQERRIEGELDYPQRRDAASSGGLEHGPDIGVATQDVITMRSVINSGRWPTCSAGQSRLALCCRWPTPHRPGQKFLGNLLRFQQRAGCLLGVALRPDANAL